MQRKRWFRYGFRFRAGIESRISVLQLGSGLDRCRDHGETGLGHWVGWGSVAANLERIGRTWQAGEPAPRSRQADRAARPTLTTDRSAHPSTATDGSFCPETRAKSLPGP